ncbi:hypothetical protein D3C78_886120 [compost metagenome]
MNVLHHHNRVIDDKAHGDDDGHQGQVVQAETEQVHQGKAGNQRHAEHAGNDQGRRPLAQEQRHHPDHQHHCNHQGDLHLMQ